MEKLLKLDPGNTELLAQKHKLLADAVSETKEKLAVDYFDTETLEIVSTEMYIDGYKAVRKADTSYKGLWEVSFTLKEF